MAKIIPRFVGVILFICAPAAAQTGKRIWVLTPPGEAVEYGPADFSPKQTVKIPSEAVKNPENFAINGAGQMLFVPGLTVIQSTADQSVGVDRIWLWNGRTGSFLDRGAVRKATPGAAGVSVVETTPQWALDADGQRIYKFANLFRKLERKGEGGEASVNTTLIAWQATLTGASPEQIAESAFPQCSCETGVCSETCPEAEFWWQAAGVNDFFTVTHVIPGQIGTTYQASYLYRKSQGKWSASKLPMVLEQMLDAAQGGEILVYAVPDGGCCGWDNEGNDQTLLTRGGKSILLFDERKSYANPNYDVSFFTSEAFLSPNAGFVAMTITSSFQPGMELRLSDGGKTDASELARIRQSLKECPAVEILRIEDQPKRVALIPRAAVAGWLNEKEILLVEGKVLVALEVATGARRQSRISVASESLVFVR